MERLTKRDKDGWVMSSADLQKIREKLADYEDAEEQGRLIEFPVAIRHPLWCFPNEHEYREMIVISLNYDIYGTKYVQVKDVQTGSTVYFNLEHLGESVFETESEAQAKLKELEADNGLTDN